jgi:hypothetical protein
MPIRKNQALAELRELFLVVYDVDSTPVEPTAITIADVLYDPGTGVCVAATGTLVPSTKPIVVPDFTFTADATTDKLHAVAHGRKNCDGPFQSSNSGGALPGGMAALTNYWLIVVDVDNVKIASSLANAIAGTAINITTNGTGVQTMSDTASTAQCIRGKFTYTFTQAETNVSAEYIALCVDRTDLRLVVQTVEIYEREMDQIVMSGVTRVQNERLMAAVLYGGVLDFETNTYSFCDPVTGVVRVTGTVDDHGRLGPPILVNLD